MSVLFITKGQHTCCNEHLNLNTMQQPIFSIVKTLALILVIYSLFLVILYPYVSKCDACMPKTCTISYFHLCVCLHLGVFVKQHKSKSQNQGSKCQKQLLYAMSSLVGWAEQAWPIQFIWSHAKQIRALENDVNGTFRYMWMLHKHFE